MMKFFMNNLKIEISFLGISIAYIFFERLWLSRVLPIGLCTNYFTDTRLNGIAAFFAITIGVYITVVTVFATSELGISKKMLKKNLDGPLINVMMAGVVENFITVGLAVFVPLNALTGRLLIVFLIIALISFAKFIHLLILIFKANMNQMAKDIDEEERYRDNLLTYLQKICILIDKKKN